MSDLVKRLRLPPFGTETSERNLMEEAAIRIAELEKDWDELQAVFNKCWEADQRAIKAWQEAHPGKDLVWPDRTKVTVWLLEKGNAASARIAELEAENAGLSANQCLHDIHGDESGNLYCPRIAELEAALRHILDRSCDTFHINPEGGANIVVEGQDRFAFESDVVALVNIARSALEGGKE